MRVAMTVAAAALAVAGCKGRDAATSSTPTPTASSTPAATAFPAASSTGSAPAGFTPPTSISRADYGGRTERRFRKLDKDGDGKLERTELPEKRADRLLRRMDKNGDGTISAAEWSDAMLARFDKQDANRDGNLTSDERGKHGGGKGGKGGGGRRHRQQQQGVADPIDDDGDEVDNGM